MMSEQNATNSNLRTEGEFQIPVLLIIFNRPDTTKVVFEKIKAIEPTMLFIAADGPRRDVNGEAELCMQTKDIVSNIDWNCKVKTLYRDDNVGCGLGPSGAISWFFEHVDMGIILEDDCVPSLPFFEYCRYILQKYKHDKQVWIVSGRNHCSRCSEFTTYDYVFSNNAHTWGWATWKRCWQHFDIEMNDKWRSFYSAGGFKNVHFSKFGGMFSNLLFTKICRDSDLKTHSWDYQFLLAMAMNRGLGVIPARNLIENIGYEGTHFSGQTSWLKLQAATEFAIVNEPLYILPNRNYDAYHTRHDFVARVRTFIANRINRLIK